ncbi:MAG: DNA mismatch repair endonuclease MutL [Deltaproteobacteria bacterium]|nr:DNA mismatch repair endonuclease MutL [Candidatus Anaeroferrophillus wilburensis]MBN2889910.1 DNA mismatch repair endonuclease MutL [Deltaproteobacteria bacterium]
MSAVSRIHILPPQVHNKIAAGEVVERPSSAVKELVENALDAGADQITVIIEEGGKQLIKVIDNGCGMGREDALLALERHATSKIISDADLFALQTFGFRGEALPSIAAVSRFILETREEGASEAVRIVCDGNAHLVTAAGAPIGTTVTVRDLFYNIPARRKFLKATSTERGGVVDCLNRFSLAHPQCSFTLIHNQKTLFVRTASARVRSRIIEVLGRQVGEELLPIASGRTDSGQLDGYISPPTVHRPNRRSLYLFVNNRVVRDQMVSQAVIRAYQGLMERGRYPVCVLFLTIDPALVDMNVHPAKEEVRFAEPGRIFSLISRSIQESLSGYRVPTAGEMLSDDPFSLLFSPVHTATGFPAAGNQPYQPSVLPPWHPPSSAIRETDATAFYGHQNQEPATPEPGFPQPATGGFFAAMQIVGQVWQSYLILSHGSQLYVVDQHAAHERILFDQLRRQMDGAQPTQQLLLPVTIDLSPAEQAVAEEYRHLLEKLGFLYEPFGNRAIILTGVPPVAGDREPLSLFQQTISDLQESEGQLQAVPGADDLAARMACRLAVKANHFLSPEEIQLLLAKLDQVDVGRTCPHGRPLYITMGKNELEKRFHRR